MIPKIKHSRSQVFTYLHDFEDGASVFGMSCDTYPELFKLAHPSIVAKAPKGWCWNPKRTCRYLWFPANALDENDLEQIEEWKQKFESYVLIGLNPNICDHFSNELDFCMALDYNFDRSTEKRTLYGEAEYQLKYKQSRPHLSTLVAALVSALGDLPIPNAERENAILTYVPSDPEKFSIPRMLAKHVSKTAGLEYVQADLSCEKSSMKNLEVNAKIPIWEKLYEQEGCVTLKGDISGRTVIVVDDLYQSGSTIWCYAAYLKEIGAAYVFGLPCVKSLRDTDNQ
jgi:predicted amidophosphoribosyltransferase